MNSIIIKRPWKDQDLQFKFSRTQMFTWNFFLNSVELKKKKNKRFRINQNE